jgi:hypothetical protein
MDVCSSGNECERGEWMILAPRFHRFEFSELFIKLTHSQGITQQTYTLFTNPRGDFQAATIKAYMKLQTVVSLCRMPCDCIALLKVWPTTTEETIWSPSFPKVLLTSGPRIASSLVRDVAHQFPTLLYSWVRFFGDQLRLSNPPTAFLLYSHVTNTTAASCS